jgi:hypothetical protein
MTLLTTNFFILIFNFYFIKNLKNEIIKFFYVYYFNGDWGLGIGDW